MHICVHTFSAIQIHQIRMDLDNPLTIKMMSWPGIS